MNNKIRSLYVWFPTIPHITIEAYSAATYSVATLAEKI